MIKLTIYLVWIVSYIGLGLLSLYGAYLHEDWLGLALLGSFLSFMEATANLIEEREKWITH